MEEFIFFVMFVVFVSTLGGLVLWKIFDIVRNSIKKNKAKYEDDKFDRLAKSFIEHRKSTDRRLENIEAIISREGLHRNQNTLHKPPKPIGAKENKPSLHSSKTSDIEVT